MSCIYAMSDIHGCVDKFEEMSKLIDFSQGNKLVLLGDYLDRKHSRPEVLTYFMSYQAKRPDQVICLMGNHEEYYLREISEAGAIVVEGDGEVSYLRQPRDCVPLKDADTFHWLLGLPPFYETEDQIFVHAGVDEDAEDLWKYACEDWYFYSKYPWTEGEFLKDIVAGHIGTSQIRASHGICPSNQVFWDGKSHYFIDGSTEYSGILSLLKFDSKTKTYTSFKSEDGSWSEYAIEPKV